ncbi:membrane protein [gut metagenome]|uniref:Membrane protein n=1 Tax=gut metagenome TaxID=749906 RepID=J9GC32_9ZZZZ
MRLMLKSMICVPLSLSWANVLSVSAVPSVKLHISISGYFSRNFLSMSSASSRAKFCRVPIGSSTVIPIRALSCVGKNSVFIIGISIILPTNIIMAPTMTVFLWRTAQLRNLA